uniref:Uncharacterized protein n=2 Tax=Haemonchus contortus TaxID=6289 RepID=A0A7I4XYM8_HAECO
MHACMQKTTLFSFPSDFSMVAPSCCLEYRPTPTFWAILVLGVFPAIYLAGKVVGTVITVLFRVLRGILKLLLWDDEDYEEELETRRLEMRAIAMQKEEERIKRRHERTLKRLQATVAESNLKNEKITTLLANGFPRNGNVKRSAPTDDISESLNSECDTDEHRVAVQVNGSAATSTETTASVDGNGNHPDISDPETPILTNVHVNRLDILDPETSIPLNGHVHRSYTLEAETPILTNGRVIRTDVLDPETPILLNGHVTRSYTLDAETPILTNGRVIRTDVLDPETPIFPNGGNVTTTTVSDPDGPGVGTTTIVTNTLYHRKSYNH